VMQELRELLYGDPDSELAHRITPNGRVSIPDEVRRYKSLTLAGRVGCEPPYLHDRKLLGRLHRITCPTLLIWGERDRLVPPANGRTFAEAIPRATLRLIGGAGHSIIMEEPQACCEHIAEFLAQEIAAAGKQV